MTPPQSHEGSVQDEAVASGPSRLGRSAASASSSTSGVHTAPHSEANVMGVSASAAAARSFSTAEANALIHAAAEPPVLSQARSAILTVRESGALSCAPPSTRAAVTSGAPMQTTRATSRAVSSADGGLSPLAETSPHRAVVCCIPARRSRRLSWSVCSGRSWLGQHGMDAFPLASTSASRSVRERASRTEGGAARISISLHSVQRAAAPLPPFAAGRAQMAHISPNDSSLSSVSTAMAVLSVSRLTSPPTVLTGLPSILCERGLLVEGHSKRAPSMPWNACGAFAPDMAYYRTK